jgi:L-malate glycosyltransferase
MNRAGSQMVRDISILVSTSLGPNLIRGKLLPLVELPEVREVILVQDVAGPKLPKVRYVTLGRPRMGKLLHAFLRVIVLGVQIVRRRPSIVMGIYMMPHGLIAYLLGRMTRRHVCVYVIAGPNEVIDGGYWVDQWQVRRPSKRLEQLYLEVLRRADVVMVVGTRTQRYLASHGVQTDRIHIVSAKVDSRRFSPVPDVRFDYDLILTAQLITLKRVDLFLRVVADLTPRHPHIRAAIMGDGPLRGELERLANRLGLDDRVDFLGFHEDIERYYNRARIFVLTSRTEGVSLAMLEAMACGLPAVVPAVGDLADVVRNGVTGYLIENDTSDAFGAAVGTLLEQEELRSRLGVNARSAILNGYTVQDGARCWSAALRSISVAEGRLGRSRFPASRVHRPPRSLGILSPFLRYLRQLISGQVATK